MREPILFTPEEFMLWFPEFSQSDRTQIERFIRQAQRECPLNPWGNDRTDAVSYLVAHKLAMNHYQVGQMAGVAVESAKGGTPQLPKGGVKDSDSNLAVTMYGQEFLRIQEGLGIMGMIV